MDMELTLFLRVALELFLQRSQFGKRRIWINRLLAWRPRCEFAVAALVRALVTVTIVPFAAPAFIAVTTMAFTSLDRRCFSWRRGNDRFCDTLRRRWSTAIWPRPVTVATPAPAMLLALSTIIGLTSGALARRSVSGRRFSVGLVPLVMMTLAPRPPILRAAAGSPDFDQLGFCGRRRFRDRSRTG